MPTPVSRIESFTYSPGLSDACPEPTATFGSDDGDLASPRHCLDRVEHDIRRHLVQLPGMPGDEERAVVGFDPADDARPVQRELQCLCDDGVEVEGLDDGIAAPSEGRGWLESFAARSTPRWALREEVPSPDRPSPAGSLLGGAEQRLSGIDTAGDKLEEIVEVVRDAAGDGPGTPASGGGSRPPLTCAAP